MEMTLALILVLAVAAIAGTRQLMVTVPNPLVHLVGTVGSILGAIAG